MTYSGADFWRMYKSWLIEERKRLDAQIRAANFKIGVEVEKEQIKARKDRQEPASNRNQKKGEK